MFIDIEYLKNNVSTIAVIFYGLFSPFLAQYWSSTEFSALVISIVGAFFIVYSASHPNTFKVLGNGG